MAKINITQVRSRIGATQTQCRNLDALGLRKMGRTVQHEDSAIIMGMVEKVKHLVTIETNADPAGEKKSAKTAKSAPEAAAKKAAPKKEAKPAQPKAVKAQAKADAEPETAEKPAENNPPAPNAAADNMINE